MVGFPLKIAAICALFSALGLTGSDQRVVMLFLERATAMQTSAGWILSIITSLMLFMLLDRECERLNQRKDGETYWDPARI